MSYQICSISCDWNCSMEAIGCLTRWLLLPTACGQLQSNNLCMQGTFMLHTCWHSCVGGMGAKASDSVHEVTVFVR